MDLPTVTDLIVMEELDNDYYIYAEKTGASELEVASNIANELVKRNVELQEQVNEYKWQVEAQQEDIKELEKQRAKMIEWNSARLEIQEELEHGIKEMEKEHESLRKEYYLGRRRMRSMCEEMDELREKCEEYENVIAKGNKNESRNVSVQCDAIEKPLQSEEEGIQTEVTKDDANLEEQLQLLKSESETAKGKIAMLEGLVQHLIQCNIDIEDRMALMKFGSETFSSLSSSSLEDIEPDMNSTSLFAELSEEGFIDDSVPNISLSLLEPVVSQENELLLDVQPDFLIAPEIKNNEKLVLFDVTNSSSTDQRRAQLFHDLQKVIEIYNTKPELTDETTSDEDNGINDCDQSSMIETIAILPEIELPKPADDNVTSNTDMVVSNLLLDESDLQVPTTIITTTSDITDSNSIFEDSDFQLAKTRRKNRKKSSELCAQQSIQQQPQQKQHTRQKQKDQQQRQRQPQQQQENQEQKSQNRSKKLSKRGKPVPLNENLNNVLKCRNNKFQLLVPLEFNYQSHKKKFLGYEPTFYLTAS